MKSAIRRWGPVLGMVLGAHAGTIAAQVPASLRTQTTATGIAYVTGGVGDGEQNALDEMKRDYNLRLKFARAGSGAYLADIKVQIDQEGRQPYDMTVLNVTSGPVLLAKLPDGQYRIRAESAGQVQSKVVRISGGKANDVIYHFPASS